MSPRAAWRFERLGFTAYDYVAGKADWMAAGLPTVRRDNSERRALDVADREPAVCGPTDPVSAVTAAVASKGSVLVVQDRVLFGRVRAKQLADARPDTPVEQIMESGPSTVRADEALDALLERMAAQKVNDAIVTTPEGRVLGVVRAD